MITVKEPFAIFTFKDDTGYKVLSNFKFFMITGVRLIIITYLIKNSVKIFSGVTPLYYCLLPY